MANHLADQTSPYLLQHKDNPVDWRPWGPEALQKAKREGKPIFLSIGYSACHWCHVMEHESFEDHSIAARLNEHFVSIKVDREERPDLDQIYMNAVQLLTGRGGWPMSLFLTPDLQPFFGGTYWPPEPRMGMPGFGQVLDAVREAWQNRREQAVEQAEKLTQHLREIGGEVGDKQALGLELLESAGGQLQRIFDFTHGGFGSAPKFPHCMDLQLLLRLWSRSHRPEYLDMVRLNLDKMAAGGIYDHLAGGFARYSVDQRWLTPHFEKMLYDNALLANVYLDAHLATGSPDYARTVRETLDYILTYMTDPQGGFHSSEDADSEGQEGKFYVWTPQEISQILGPAQAERFCYVDDVTEQGNFEHGCSILNLPKSIAQCAALKGWDLEELRRELAESRRELLAVRDQRVRPGKDDKVLASWNALMIDAMARAAGVLEQPGYLAAAQHAARFLLQRLRRPDQRLLHCWRRGQAKFDAYLDDYTYLINALVSLYEATFEETWVEQAVRLAEILMAQFRDVERGGFFFTAEDHEPLIARNKDIHDSSVPSGNSMAATALLRLGRLCGRADFEEAARETLEAGVAVMQRSPSAAGQMLVALDYYLGPSSELVVIGDPTHSDTAAVLAACRKRFEPRCLLAGRSADDSPPAGSPLQAIFAGKSGGPELPAVYLCENFHCQEPAHGRAAALELLHMECGDSSPLLGG